jgi:hypothetical protein
MDTPVISLTSRVGRGTIVPALWNPGSGQKLPLQDVHILTSSGVVHATRTGKGT